MPERRSGRRDTGVAAGTSRARRWFVQGASNLADRDSQARGRTGRVQASGTGEQGGPPRFRGPAGRAAGEAHHWRHIPIAGCCSGHEIAARGPNDEMMKSVDDSADDRAIASEALPILANPLPKTLP